jgi:hypothetical protein
VSRVDGGWLASGKPAVGAWLLLTERAVSFPRRRLSISDPSAGADSGGSIVSVALSPPPHTVLPLPLPPHAPPPPDSSCSKFRVLQSVWVDLSYKLRRNQ